MIFVTPEYNYGIPGGLKNAIDWVSRMKDQPFKDKPVAIQSVAGGPLGGGRVQYQWRQIMVFLEALAFTRPEVFVGMAAQQVRREDAGVQGRGRHQLHQAAARRVSRSYIRKSERGSR